MLTYYLCATYLNMPSPDKPFKMGHHNDSFQKSQFKRRSNRRILAFREHHDSRQTSRLKTVFSTAMSLFVFIVFILYQGHAAAFETATLDTDAFGRMNHSFYVISNTPTSYVIDQRGHVPDHHLFNNPDVFLAIDHRSLHEPITTSAIELMDTPDTIYPYELMQKIVPRTLKHHGIKSSIVHEKHTHQHGLVFFYAERCNIYLIGNHTYEGCQTD